MKVFNLCCGRDHAFEGWFASAEAFEAQLERGLVECPVCGEQSVRRMPSAPRLNLSSSAAPPQPTGKEGVTAGPTPEQLQRIWQKMARYIRENTEDVGERFAEEARRIHYDEAPERAIRGIASRQEASELADEGIEVISFPMPKGPEGPLQ
jgi:hypothetical protein